MIKAKLLIDRSGSMDYDSKMIEAIGSVNGYVAELAKSTSDAEIQVVAFDSVNPYEVVRNGPITEFAPLTYEEIYPRGGTPLYRATTTLIELAEEEGGDRVVILIMTDGEDTDRNQGYLDQARRAIERIEQRGWQVVFLGANFDNANIAKGLNLSASSYSANVGNGGLMRSMSRTADMTVAYASGARASMAYTTEDIQFMDGEDEAPI